MNPIGSDDSIPMDYLDNTAAQNPSLNSVTGTLGKAFDTFLDALAIKGAGKIVGTTYPTGQEDPAAVAAKQQADKNTLAAAQAFNWKPWAIGGGIAFAGILLLAVVVPRKS